jgi:hypothetical protein
MKKYHVLVLLVAICFVAFSCSQPKAPTGTTAPKAASETPAASAAPPDAPAEESSDAGELKVAESAESVEVAAAVDEAPAAPEAVENNKPEDANAAGEPAVEGGTPKLVVPEPVFDFGTLRDSETLTHKFLLRNEGTGVLEITNVRASCGCTATELEKDKLAPGEEVHIGAVVNLSGRQGKQVKAITITTNDPETQSLQLRMEGMVTASIQVDPDRVNFGEIKDDNPREAIINITSTLDDLTFTVQSAEVTDMDFIQHEIKEVEAGKAYQVIVKTVGELPVGQHNARMIIRTDTKVRPVIFMNISMQVIGPLAIMPPVIHIRHSETPGEVTSQQLRISSGRIENFEITEVVVPVEGMKATLTPQGENVYLLRLENMPSSDILQDKAVILRTNIEAHPEVPINFNVAKLKVAPSPAGAPQAQMPEKIMELTPEQRKMMRERAVNAPPPAADVKPEEAVNAEGEAAPAE